MTTDHVVLGFSRGKPELDHRLVRRAMANQFTGATKTHVVIEGGRVIGFYSLANGAVGHADVRDRIRRNMAIPIPAVILARLAVDEKYRGVGLGSALLQSAIYTTLSAAQTMGIVCLLVHAKDQGTREFYLHFGFEPSPTDPLHLILRLAEISG